MIKSWLHKGSKEFFETGNIKGIQAKHKSKLQNQLSVLNIIVGRRNRNTQLAIAFIKRQA